ncbi:hypothetical protein T439DRAFT_314822 [Meredithblackwellia eburnea MCA 4105]
MPSAASTGAGDGGAVVEHAFYCFEIINAKLNGGKAIVPEFDQSQEFPLFVTWNIASRATGSTRLRGCIGNFEASPIEEGLRDYAAISAFKDHRFDPISSKELTRLECGVSLLTDFELCDDYLDWEVGTHGIYIQLPNPALAAPAPISSTPGSEVTSANTSSASLPSASGGPGAGQEKPKKASYRSISQLPAFRPAQQVISNPKRLSSVLTATYLPDVAPSQNWSKVEAVDSAMRKAGYQGRITEELRKSLRVTRYQSRKVNATHNEWSQWRQGRS